jgi:hypothetical protein
MTDEAAPDEPAPPEPGDEAEEEAVEWPIKGPATPGQAIVAIAFVFFLGVALGFALCKAF